MRVSEPRSVEQMPSSQMERIRKGSSQFEAMLLNEMLSKLRSTFCDSTDTDSGDPSADTLTGMGMEALSSALAARGGFGLGQMMMESLKQQTTQVSAPMADGKAEGLQRREIRTF